MKSETVLTTKNFIELVAPTGNIYKSTVIIAKRAKAIASELKAELNNKLADFELHQEDSLEEVLENKEHTEISKLYEKKPKATLTATYEFLGGKITGHYPEVTDAPESV